MLCRVCADLSSISQCAGSSSSKTRGMKRLVSYLTGFKLKRDDWLVGERYETRKQWSPAPATTGLSQFRRHGLGAVLRMLERLLVEARHLALIRKTLRRVDLESLGSRLLTWGDMRISTFRMAPEISLRKGLAPHQQP